MAADAYTTELDELMAACRKAEVPIVAPTDRRFGSAGLLLYVGLTDRRLEPLEGRFRLTPSGRKHTIIEWKGES